MKRIFLLLVALLALESPAIAQTPDLNVNGSSPYISLGKGIAWSAVNRAYFFTPLSPQSTICTYFVNNNPTSSHTLTVQIFQSGDPQVTNYSSNTGRFTAATLQGTISPIAASATGSAFSITNAAASIAIVVSGATTQPGSPDTVDAYVVQTSANNCGSVGGGIQIIGGPVAVGGSPAGFNPLFLGCQDQGGGGGYSAPAGQTMQPILCDNSFSSGGGLLIGAQFGSSVGANYSSGGWIDLMHFNNGASPIGVSPCLINQSGLCIAQGASANLAGNASALVTSGGWYSQTTQTISANTTIAIGANTAQVTSGIGNACTLEVAVTGSVTGTGPTMNVYFQDSDLSSGNWADRISFTQFTTATRQIATVVTGTAGVVPYAPTNQTLAAGTIINGPIRAPARIAIVVGGTSPSFGNVRFTLTCS